MVGCNTTIYYKTKSRGKAHHQQLSQNKYIMVECDTTIYHKTKSRSLGNTINVITNKNRIQRLQHHDSLPNNNMADASQALSKRKCFVG